MEKRVMDALRAHFRPEFLNRVDDIVIFPFAGGKANREDRRHPDGASPEASGRAEDHAPSDDQGQAFPRQAGYDPVYGARPLKRAIQKYLQDPLSMQILEGISKDGDTVTSDAADIGGLTFKKD
jgi:ATP-dependent Clp protease ATP-binding subunit ClpB